MGGFRGVASTCRAFFLLRVPGAASVLESGVAAAGFDDFAPFFFWDGTDHRLDQGGSCLDRGHRFDQRRANHLFRGKGNSAVDDV